MPSFNKVVLIGRLVRDPELRYTSSGLAVASFTIAVDRRFKNQQGERQTDFFRCTAWRQKAEFVQQYIHKGRLVLVEGAIELNEYTAQDGSRRTSPDIQCDNIETLEAQRDGEGGAPAPRENGTGGYNAPQGGGDGEYFDDDMSGGRAPARAQAAAPAASAPAAAPRAAQGGGQGAPRPQGGGQGAPRAQGAPQGGQGGGRGPAPQPGYPQNDYDFDDSDPFADE